MQTANAHVEASGDRHVPAVWVPEWNRTIRLPAMRDAMECARVCDAINLHYANDDRRAAGVR